VVKGRRNVLGELAEDVTEVVEPISESHSIKLLQIVKFLVIQILIA
jgi:hypothetical protein